MKCGPVRADGDVLAMALGRSEEFRGTLDYANVTPTCPERGKAALKQMLPLTWLRLT